MKTGRNFATQRPLRVLIAPDKFKGALSAAAAADAIAAGWSQARPADILELFPISDGGDGFGELYGKLVKAKAKSTATLNAAHRACRSRWYWDRVTKTAVIDSSSAIGLARLPPGKFHPFELDTFGLGKLLKAATKIGAKHCILGIGGSATNDGGFGLARSLGWKFLDADQQEIRKWLGLNRLHSLKPPKASLLFDSIIVAVDVQNPLLGHRGASRVYGPQKGLQAKDFRAAEAALRRLAVVMKKQLGRDLAPRNGAGAAGGLGFGLTAFLGARLVPGFELFAKLSELETHLGTADLVITGEGSIDRSTMMGKGVGELSRLCSKAGKHCFALAGKCESASTLARHFRAVGSLTQITSEAEAKRRPTFWLARAASKMALRHATTIGRLTWPS
jgi:glycerate 2-kinase